MKTKIAGARLLGFGLTGLALAGAAGGTAAQEGPALSAFDALQRQVDEQARHIEYLKRELERQQGSLEALRGALEDARARGTAPATAAAPASAPTAPAASRPTASAPGPVAQAERPVGQAPARARQSRPPEVAPIFEQPGVLTPRGRWVVEPSLQYSYSSSNRVALVGFTIIPAIHIGLIDVREVKSDTFVGALTVRRGITNRFELEAKIPYVYRSDTSVARRVAVSSAADEVFDVDGHGLGDIEFTGRYQLNDGGPDRPYFIGSLRFKTRTGRDPFEVRIDRTLSGTTGTGLQTEMPTGSGFYSLQPGLTVLLPSDPVVFFGGVSYQYSFEREDVKQKTNAGREPFGDVQPGGVFGFNFGMGLALNERSSFSLGYDHLSVGKLKQNGRTAPTSVRVQLGTLLLGYSYRLDATRTVNLTVGAGLTEDTPDLQLTLRMPFSL